MKFVDSKRALNPIVVYATDRSKAVVRCWSYFGLYYEAIRV